MCRSLSERQKGAVGIGGNYGRGLLVCREGEKMDGGWGAPAMHALDQASLGVKLGSTATDFVLVVMHNKGVDAILNGKMKLGVTVAAAAGPTGAQATGYAAQAMSSNVLTYSRSKGLFAGVSLEGASIEADNDAKLTARNWAPRNRHWISRGCTGGQTAGDITRHYFTQSQVSLGEYFLPMPWTNYIPLRCPHRSTCCRT